MNRDISAEEAVSNELFEKFDFKGKQLGEISSDIQNELFKQEKKIIFRLDEMKSMMDGVMDELQQLDDKYREVQGIIDLESSHFNKLSSDVELIENQKKLIETRSQNQQKLQETLTILLSGLQLTAEENKILDSPKFSNADELRKAEDVIDKVGKFLKFQVDRFRNMKLYQNQVEIMEDKLIAFTTSFKEDLSRLAKKSIGVKAEDDREGMSESGKDWGLDSIDLSTFKQGLMQRRRVLKSLLSARSGQPKFFGTLMSTIRDCARLSVERASKEFESKLRNGLERSPLIKSRASFSRKLATLIAPIVAVEQFNNSDSLMQNFQFFLTRIDGILEQDANYWSKFFSFESTNKYTKDNEDILALVHDIYEPIFNIILKTLKEIVASTPLSAYAFIVGAQNAITANASDRNEADYDEGDDSRSDTTSNNENSRRVSAAISDVSRRSGAVAQMISAIALDSANKENNNRITTTNDNSKEKNTIYSNLLSSISSDLSKAKTVNMKAYVDYLSKVDYNVNWMKEQSEKEEKYTCIRMVCNLQPICIRLRAQKYAAYKEYTKSIEGVYSEQETDYCIELFCYQFKKFSEMWFKIKNVEPSEWESDSSFKASTFVKSINTTFNSIDKELDAVIKRIRKHFCKDPEATTHSFNALTRFIGEEYSEIEQMCMKALRIKITPSLAEVQSKLEKKKAQLSND